MLLSSINNAVRARRASVSEENAPGADEDPVAHSTSDLGSDDEVVYDEALAPVHREYSLKELIHGLVAGYPLGDEPQSLPWVVASQVITNLVFVVILLSVVSFGVSTLPQFKDGNPVTDGIEIFCVTVFTVELVIRAVTHQSQLEFWTNGLTWVDIISILPFYLQLILNGDNTASALVFFRVLRLVRVTRVFKLVKNNVGFEAVFESLVTSKEALSLMGFMILVALCFFSSAIYFAEIDSNSFDTKSGQWIRPSGEVNPYQSMFHAMWWCIVTITTVGYGDDVPVTGGGKFVAAVAAICGVFVISFPSAILGANFAEIHARKIREREAALKRAKRAKVAKTSLVAENEPEVKEDTMAVSMRRITSDGIPTRASHSLSYTMEADGPEREIVVSRNVASYSPALVLLTQESDPWVLVARQELLFPPPARNLIFTIVLASQATEDSVARALTANGLATNTMSIQPRRVERLLVHASLPEDMNEAGVLLSTAEFIRPSGQVPLVFYCPTEASESLLMKEIDRVDLRFKVTYAASDEIVLSLQNYRTAQVIRSRASMAVLRGGNPAPHMNTAHRLSTGGALRSKTVLLADVHDEISSGEETPPVHPLVNAS